jgi:hypothetical protein
MPIILRRQYDRIVSLGDGDRNDDFIFVSSGNRYSTVTLFARLRGWSTSVPFKTATW